MNDSSEPVESRITRTSWGGSSASSWARATSTATALRLSFAPGTTLLAPMFAITPSLPARRTSRSASASGGPSSPQSASSSGPRKTPNMIGMLWLARSCSFGISSMPLRGSAGWKTSPLWAAS